MRHNPTTARRFGLRALAEEARPLHACIAFILAAIVVSYSGYWLFDRDVVIAIGREDALFENLTAIFFFAAAVLFLMSFLKGRNGFLLALALVLFVGAGEEIAWGQRLLGFATPPAIDAVNVQHEFTVHNLVWVHSTDMSGNYKQGIEKVLTVNFLYKVFWLSFGVLIPFAARASTRIGSFLRRWRIPVASLPIGLLFAVNWLAYRAAFAALPPGEIDAYYATAGEMAECLSALVFLSLGWWFLREQTPRRSTAATKAALASRT